MKALLLLPAALLLACSGPEFGASLFAGGPDSGAGAAGAAGGAGAPAAGAGGGAGDVAAGAAGAPQDGGSDGDAAPLPPGCAGAVIVTDDYDWCAKQFDGGGSFFSAPSDAQVCTAAVCDIPWHQQQVYYCCATGT